jgi:hypothetical protein
MTKNVPISEDGELFTSLTLNGNPLSECECVPIREDSMHLYVLKREGPHEGSGFDFVVTEFVSCGADRGRKCYEDPTLRVERIAYGVAYFDGLRHVNMGESGEGYLYYPDALALSVVFTQLRYFEQMYCSDKIARNL